MRERWLSRLGLAVMVAASPSCIQRGRVCTAIGCGDSAVFDLNELRVPAGTLVDVCAKGSCRQPADGTESVLFDLDLDRGETVTFTMRLRASSGSRTLTASVPVRPHQPNGADCGPTCYVVGVKYDLASDSLQPS